MADQRLGTSYPEQQLQFFIRDHFSNCGQDSYSKPPSQDPDMLAQFYDCLPVTRGVIEPRWGYADFFTTTALYTKLDTYRNESSNFRKIVATSPTATTAFNEDGTAYRASIFTPNGLAGTVRMVNSRDYAYFSDGVQADLLKWDGSAGNATTKWGITAPATAISIGAPTGGSVTLTQGRKYYCVFENATTLHNSDLSPVSASSGPLVAQNVPLSNIPVSLDTQVTQKLILATADGGDESTLFLLTTLANATTTYTDSTTETTLLASNIYLESDDLGFEHGVSNNTPPPNGTVFIKHLGRLWTFVGQFLYFSKSADEITTSTATTAGRYEEAWPAVNFMDISEQAETVKGLFSDGSLLYVGTERHIRKIAGDSLVNFDKPEILFSECGIANQDVWRAVFVEGQPVGAMWLTPDFKIIASDFNTYQDIGTPVQDVLNSINTAVASKAHASFYSSTTYDWYVLAIPTGSNTDCDTLLVFDLRRKKWAVWRPAGKVTAMLYNINASGIPQFIWANTNNGSTGTVNLLSAASTTDRGTAITPVVLSSWLHLGNPHAVKLLNELELITGDANIRFSLLGANSQTDFNSGGTFIKSSVLPVSSLYGQKKVFLAGATTPYRWYQLKFAGAGGSVTGNVFLGSYRLTFSTLNAI